MHYSSLIGFRRGVSLTDKISQKLQVKSCGWAKTMHAGEQDLYCLPLLAVFHTVLYTVV